MEVNNNRLQLANAEINAVNQRNNTPPQEKVNNTTPTSYSKQDSVSNRLNNEKMGNSLSNIGFTQPNTFNFPNSQNQESTFSSYENAVNAADKIDGIKVIIDNKDGTFKVEKVTQKQLENILDNRNKFPDHVGVVSPYRAFGKDLESQGTKMSHEVKLSTKGNSYDIGDFLKEIDMSNSPRLGSMINIAGNHRTYNGVRNAGLANKSGEITQILGNNISGCRDILSKLSNQRILTPQDASLLKSQLTNIIANAESLGLSEADVAKLKSFCEDVAKIESLDAQYKQEEANFIKIRSEQADNINELCEQINELEKNPALSYDQKNVLGFLKQNIFGDFARNIMNSNDPAQITLYNKFMRNILEGMESVPPITGPQIAEMLKEHNVMSAILAKHAHSEPLTSENNQKLQAYLKDATPEEQNIINSYLSVPSQQTMIQSNATNLTGNNTPSNGTIDTTSSGNSSTGNTTRVPPEGFQFSGQAIAQAATLSPSGYSVLKLPVTDRNGNTSTLSDSFKKVVETGNRQMETLNKMVVNRVERHKLEVKVIEQLPEIMPIITKAETNNAKNIEKALYEEIKKHIEKAEELEDNLDLSVEGTTNELVSLLEKFRGIISELDIDSRDIIYKKMVSKMTDDSFSNYLKENKKKLADLDESRKTIQSIFNKSTEVRDSSLPQDIKEKKYYDELTKLALMSFVA